MYKAREQVLCNCLSRGCGHRFHTGETFSLDTLDHSEIIRTKNASHYGCMCIQAVQAIAAFPLEMRRRKNEIMVLQQYGNELAFEDLVEFTQIAARMFSVSGDSSTSDENRLNTSKKESANGGDYSVGVPLPPSLVRRTLATTSPQGVRSDGSLRLSATEVDATAQLPSFQHRVRRANSEVGMRTGVGGTTVPLVGERSSISSAGGGSSIMKSCTKEQFALAMLLKLKKITTGDIQVVKCCYRYFSSLYHLAHKTHLLSPEGLHASV